MLNRKGKTMLDYIELTTLIVAIIGVSIVIIKTLGELIKATEIQTAEFSAYRDNCSSKFDEIKDDLDNHEDYIIDHEKRISKLEVK